MTDAPEKMWAWETENCNGPWTIAEGEGVSYIRTDLHLALVAAALRAKCTSCWGTGYDVGNKCSCGIPYDAQAALEREKHDARNDALREAAELVAGHSEFVRLSDPVRRHLQKRPEGDRMALAYVDAILALMEDENDE